MLPRDSGFSSRLDFANPLALGNHKLPGTNPIAMLYAGHQFGHYVPQLGDRRADYGPKNQI
jgi:protein adenylyltransferase